MALDYGTFRKHVEERNKRHLQEQKSEIKAAALAAAPMEQLIGDPKWDFMLRALQSKIDGAEHEISALKDVLADPSVVAHDDIMVRKMQLLFTRGRIVGMREAMALPSEILERGKTAIKRLEDISDDEDT